MMATQDSFLAQEWTQLRLTPSLVSAGMTAVEPSGIFASIKEAVAGARGVAEAFKANGALELFAALAADKSFPALPDLSTIMGKGSREEQMENFRTTVLARVRSAVELVVQKGSPAEAAAYRAMLVDVAERAANAAKEGGFLGFGGARVSASEESLINEVKKAAGFA
ncbi:MAG: hypothetical protein ABIR79_24060 [Candidatus Binatia bacterium]